MTPEEIQQQREVDEEIASYVRAMQESAPVGAESVTAFLRNIRRRTIAQSVVLDRLADLAAREILAREKVFQPGGGFAYHYTCTGRGRAMLDRAIPWDWEMA